MFFLLWVIVVFFFKYIVIDFKEGEKDRNIIDERESSISCLPYAEPDWESNHDLPFHRLITTEHAGRAIVVFFKQIKIMVWFGKHL